MTSVKDRVLELAEEMRALLLSDGKKESYARNIIDAYNDKDKIKEVEDSKKKELDDFNEFIELNNLRENLYIPFASFTK